MPRGRGSRSIVSRHRPSATFVAVSLLAYAIGGVVWGWRRAPVGVRREAAHGGLELADAQLPVISDYAWLILATSVLALLTSSWGVATRRIAGLYGLWLALSCALAGAVGFFVSGQYLAGARFPALFEDLYQLAPGETLQLLPPLRLGPAPLAAAFVATLSVWVHTFLEPDVPDVLPDEQLDQLPDNTAA